MSCDGLAVGDQKTALNEHAVFRLRNDTGAIKSASQPVQHRAMISSLHGRKPGARNAATATDRASFGLLFLDFPDH